MERELLILGLLRNEKMHGYQMAEFIEHNLAACLDLKKATAYFLLDKMYSAGWVTYKEDQEGNRPLRRVYEITAEGEAAFQRLLRENLASYTPPYFVSDIGLGFLDVLKPEEALSLLKKHRDIMTEQYSSLKAVPIHPGGFQWALEHRISHLNAELIWIETLLKKIGEQISPTILS